VDNITLHVPEEALREAEQKLLAAGARPGTRRIAIAPGAAYGSAKCWLPERYAEVADGLIAAADADVILFGAPPERDMAERLANGMKRCVVNLAGATSIGELPALLRACSVFVGNDSGAMHVAAAVGLPVVGIFGPTDPDATRPASTQFTLIREPVSCSPCLLRRCPIDHRCMTRISVEQVSGVTRALLERPSPPASREARSAGIV
jgi:heptosyltransferase-2